MYRHPDQKEYYTKIKNDSPLPGFIDQFATYPVPINQQDLYLSK